VPVEIDASWARVAVSNTAIEAVPHCATYSLPALITMPPALVTPVRSDLEEPSRLRTAMPDAPLTNSCA
jgi:hypothetical protein